MTDSGIYSVEVALAFALTLGALLLLFVHLLTRRRPGLAIAWPIGVAFLLRLLAIFVVSNTRFAGSLRGGDELDFLRAGHAIAGTPFASGDWLSALTGKFYLIPIALQDYLFHPHVDTMRILEVTLSVAGTALVATATYELAGPRAAWIVAWLLAIEPTTMLFSQLLHKEPPIYFAEGLVAFGGAKLWKHGKLSALLPMALGCLIATATRHYSGWFLIAATALIVLHQSLRLGATSSVHGFGLLAIVVVVLALGVPFVLQSTTNQSLATHLQNSQSTNAANTTANLSLEQVNYSSRSAIITNLPVRLFDVTFKPYPWRLANTSQQLGPLGGLPILLMLILLFRYGRRSWGSIMERAGPLVYLAALVMICYSLSAGNAGTSFRYRTHVVVLVVAIICVLRAHVRQEDDVPAEVFGMAGSESFAYPDRGRNMEAPQAAATATT